LTRAGSGYAFRQAELVQLPHDRGARRGLASTRLHNENEKMAKDFRQNDRVVAMLPVRFEEGGVGLTRNLSPGGVYFVVDESIVAGRSVRFSLEFNTGDSLAADL